LKTKPDKNALKSSPSELEPWLFTSLQTTLPVAPAGNSLNCLYAV